MRSALLLATLALVACATSTPAPQTAPDRILVVDSDGTVLHQSTADENAVAHFTARIEQVWPALALAYSELGIEPTVIDRAGWRYGNTGFIVPRRIQGRPIANYFNCGSGISGQLVDLGRGYANVTTTLTANPPGST